MPERAKVHPDRGYDSRVTRERLGERGLLAEVSQKGRPATLAAALRWVGSGAYQLLVAQRPQRGSGVVVYGAASGAGEIDFWVAFSEVIIIVRRLIREGWSRYRWEGRPSRKP